MRRPALLALAVALVLPLAACSLARARTYRMPLSAAEAPLVFPALGAAAEKLGYKTSTQSGSTFQMLNVQLPDGARFSWTNNATNFGLVIYEPKRPKDAPEPSEAELDAQFRELKVKADEVWELAIELRQKNNVGAAVVVNPTVIDPLRGPPQPQPGGPQQGFQGSWSTQPTNAPAPAPMGGQPCRSSLDCGAGGWCKDWRGSRVCMNKGGPGAPCTSSIDCGSGLFCRGDTCG